MVAGKKAQCAYCHKRCSGNVLRYQDHYYHKQCFELEQQSELAAAAAAEAEAATGVADAKTPTGKQRPESRTPTATSGAQQEEPSIKQQQRDTASTTMTTTSSSSSSKTTKIQRQYLPASSASSYQLSGGSSQSQPSEAQQQLAATRAKSQTLQPTASGRPTELPPKPRNQEASGRAATLPHNQQHQQQSKSNGLSAGNSYYLNDGDTTRNHQQLGPLARCAGCGEQIRDGQALIALDLQWHVWCFKCCECKVALHGEYVAKDGRAYCERDYQKLFGITCVYCKRYITGKVLQAGEAHHFHPSCARCSKCGDPFVPGEEMYLQGEVTWHPRCGPGPESAAAAGLADAEGDSSSRLQLPRGSRPQSPSLSNRSRSRSASPYSFMSRQYGRASPAYADSEAVGDLSRIYTISYLNADPTQGYLRRPIEPNPPKSPSFSRPTSTSRLGPLSDRSRCSSRSQTQTSNYLAPGGARERSIPRGMYSVLSGASGGRSSVRARSPSMMNEEAIQLAAYPSGQKPPPNALAKIERDDFPAPPFPSASSRSLDRRHHHHHHQHQRHHHHKRRHHHHPQSSAAGSQQQVDEGRASRPRSREFAGQQQPPTNGTGGGGGGRGSVSNSASSSGDSDDERDGTAHSDDDDDDDDQQFRKEEEELSKIANGIGKIFLQTLKEREKLRAWKRANLDPRNSSRTPSATRELPAKLRYENPTNASPSRDLDSRRAVWATGTDDEQQVAGGDGSGGERDSSPSGRTRSSLGRQQASGRMQASSPASAATSYGYKVVQANRLTPKPGYGLAAGPPFAQDGGRGAESGGISFAEQQRYAQHRSTELLNSRLQPLPTSHLSNNHHHHHILSSEFGATRHQPQGTTTAAAAAAKATSRSPASILSAGAHLRRSMPNVANLHHLHQEGPPKLYPYHLLATSNYRLPPDVDRCHLERHLSNEEFQYIFHCDRLDFYRLPEWKRNELKRRAKLF